MERALQGTQHDIELQKFTTLADATEYFCSLSEKDPIPHLVFIDLMLNGHSSLPILRLIKGKELLQTLPVLILSASEQDSDIYEAWKFGASAYIKKPLRLSELRQTVAVTLNFWLSLAKRPYQWARAECVSQVF